MTAHLGLLVEEAVGEVGVGVAELAAVHLVTGYRLLWYRRPRQGFRRAGYHL
jgi:hypothetical protein